MVMSRSYQIDLDALPDNGSAELLTPPGSVYYAERSLVSASTFGQENTNQVVLPTLRSQSAVYVISAEASNKYSIATGSGPVCSIPPTLMSLPPNGGKLTLAYPYPELTPSNGSFVPEHSVTTQLTHHSSASAYPKQNNGSSTISYVVRPAQSDTVDENKMNCGEANVDNWVISDETGKNQQIGKRRRGRPRLESRGLRHIYNPADDFSFSNSHRTYHVGQFWCPLCQWCYPHPSLCPDHPVIAQPDHEVISYARQTLPKCFKLSEEHGVTRVRIIKRQPSMTQFGPLVAPALTEEELLAHPEWLPDCPFRIDVLDSDGQSVGIRYLKLGDEAVCNWMMFVRLVCTTMDQSDVNDLIPNAVAYQLGADGIFLLLTRPVISGEELIATYSPTYAIRFGLPISVVGLESFDPSMNRPVHRRQFPDEIHCFHCSLTFASEDAFRVHCLGHQGELSLRGIPTRSVSTDGTDISAGEVNPTNPKAPSIDGEPEKSCITHTDSGKTETRSARPQSTLRCSLCAVEVGDVIDLIQHTDSYHSLSRPRVFATRNKLPKSSNIQSPSITPRVLAAEDDKLYKLETSLTKNLVVVDLGQLDSFVCDDLPVAYGCGQCGQRVPTMQALQNHKELVHEIRSQAEQFTQPSASSFRPPCEETNANVNLSFSNAVEQPECPLSPLRIAFTSEDWNDNGTDALDMITSVDLLLSNLEKNVVEESKKRVVGTSFDCCICGEELRSRSALSVHMRTHCSSMHVDETSGGRSAQLAQTATTTMSSVDGPSIQLRRRPPRVPVVKRLFFCCSVCGKGQTSQKALRQHSAVHQRSSDGRYPCPLCAAHLGRSYETFQQLQRHIGFVHHPRELFPCPYCERTFGRRKNLDNHLVRHTGRREFVCPYENCKKGFGRKDKLKLHLKTHEQAADFGTTSCSQ
ncbi:PR domain zinc finger protein 10 [Clonorchis sinensis]|uniref:PR domain zinc finger protein 10 n=1 Tax=Clonorchis sinensis TaxID=79923 RepID=A0A8T1MQ57_CLOSI|nr:PR domain zinc finger protein 10 [Clonorchis sinensis]